MQRYKKPLIITACVAGGLILLACLLGVLNGLFGAREWLGWVNYSYRDEGWEAEGGTVPAETLSGVNLDWIDGNIRVVACDDRFPSLTEACEGTLSDSLMLRWTVDKDGVLQIRYRASALWHPVWQNREKELILRLPRHMTENMDITLNTRGANVFLEGIRARTVTLSATDGNLSQDSACAFVSLSAETGRGKMLFRGENGTTVLTTKHGEIRVEGAPTAPLTVTTKTADVHLIMSPGEGVTVRYRTEDPRYISDLPVREEGDTLLIGTGAGSEMVYTTESGQLYIESD